MTKKKNPLYYTLTLLNPQRPTVSPMTQICFLLRILVTHKGHQVEQTKIIVSSLAYICISYLPL